MGILKGNLTLPKEDYEEDKFHSRARARAVSASIRFSEIGSISTGLRANIGSRDGGKGIFLLKLRNCSLKGSTEIASFYGSWLCRSPRHVFDSCGHLSRNREELEYTEARKLMWTCPESGQRTSHGAQRDLAASVQDKLVALKTGLHFPYVLRVISLRSVHCLTHLVLAHRRCSLGATNESKQERLAFRSAPFCNHTSIK